jgi:hypothetical protein
MSGDAGRRDERFTCFRVAHTADVWVSVVAPVRFNRIEIDPSGVAVRLFPDGFRHRQERSIRTEATPYLPKHRAVRAQTGTWPHLASPGLTWYRSLRQGLAVVCWTCCASGRSISKRCSTAPS